MTRTEYGFCVCKLFSKTLRFFQIIGYELIGQHVPRVQDARDSRNGQNVQTNIIVENIKK